MKKSFEPINSQEEFEELIKSRLEREANKVRGEFADYEEVKNNLAAKTKEAEDLADKITDFENQIKALSAKLSASETDVLKARIAYEMNLPPELKDRLTGTTETEIRRDAETLARLVSDRHPAPLFSIEGSLKSEDYEMREMLQKLGNR